MMSSIRKAVSSLAFAASLFTTSDAARAVDNSLTQYLTLEVVGSAFTESKGPVEQGQLLNSGQSIALDAGAEIILLGTGGRVILNGGLQGGRVQLPSGPATAPLPYLNALMDFVKTALDLSRGPVTLRDMPVEVLRIDRPGNKCVIAGITPKIGAAGSSGRRADIIDLTTGDSTRVDFFGDYADWPKTLKLSEAHEYSAAVNGTARIVTWRLSVIPNFSERLQLVQAFAAHECSDQILAMALKAPLQSVLQP